MKTQDGRKLLTEALHDLRLRVVSAVEEEGMKAVEAMRVFGVGRTALFGWLKA
jgi:transposase